MIQWVILGITLFEQITIYLINFLLATLVYACICSCISSYCAIIFTSASAIVKGNLICLKQSILSKRRISHTLWRMKYYVTFTSLIETQRSSIVIISHILTSITINAIINTYSFIKPWLWIGQGPFLLEIFPCFNLVLLKLFIQSLFYLCNSRMIIFMLNFTNCRPLMLKLMLRILEVLIIQLLLLLKDLKELLDKINLSFWIEGLSWWSEDILNLLIIFGLKFHIIEAFQSSIIIRCNNSKIKIYIST